MSRYSNAARDQKIADEANDAQTPGWLMCSAHGCPNLWSTDVPSKLCRWHAVADPMQWPRITEEMRREVEDRAIYAASPKAQSAPLSREEKRKLMARMHEVLSKLGEKDPKAWAHVLKAREERGDRLSLRQREAWREALNVSKPANLRGES